MKKVHTRLIRHVRRVSSLVYIIFAITAACIVVVLGGLALFISIKDIAISDRIYPQVFINGKDFGGKSTDELTRFFDEKNEALEKITVELRYKDTDTAVFSGGELGVGYDTKTIAVHAASIGRSANLATKIYQKVITHLNLAKYNFAAHPAYDSQLIDDYLDSLDEKYSKPAENALFTFENGKVTAFAPEKLGVEIKKDAVRQTVDAAVVGLERKPTSFIITISDEIIQPEVTLSSTNTFGITEEIGKGVSDFAGSIPGRVHNLTLASSRLNGVLIPQGEVFSFNKTIGDISAQTGYKPAYIISKGRTVLGDGGGVCQVSTTLFRAALNAGLPIVERVAHAYRVHYYEQDSQPGFDATVFNPSADLKIKNNTGHAILIQTAVDAPSNKLTFILHGKKDGRVAEISNVRLYYKRGPPPPLYQDDPTLKRGITKQVDWPAEGAKASFHYRVVKNGETIIDTDFFSAYRPWRAVYLVGTAE